MVLAIRTVHHILKNTAVQINSLLNKKSKTTEVNQLKMDNRIITGDQNIAACFND